MNTIELEGYNAAKSRINYNDYPYPDFIPFWKNGFYYIGLPEERKAIGWRDGYETYVRERFFRGKRLYSYLTGMWFKL